MHDRFLKVVTWIGMVLILSIPGVVVIWLMPVQQLIHESHGFVGVAFGLIIVFGAAAMNTLIWVLTGRSWFDRLFMGDL